MRDQCPMTAAEASRVGARRDSHAPATGTQPVAQMPQVVLHISVSGQQSVLDNVCAIPGCA